MFTDVTEMRDLELFFDFVQLFDIVLTCFTARRSNDISESTRQYLKKRNDDDMVNPAIKYTPEWEKNIKVISLEYLKTDMIQDLLACVPLIITVESVVVLYPFKILRVTKIKKVIRFLQMFSQLLKERYQRHQITIENIYSCLTTVCALVYFLHLLSCAFIAIGHISSSEEDNSVYWIERLGIEHTNKREVYWTAWYFITTTITTIGYGDIAGQTAFEKIFLIFLLFVGILCFTVI